MLILITNNEQAGDGWAMVVTCLAEKKPSENVIKLHKIYSPDAANLVQAVHSPMYLPFNFPAILHHQMTLFIISLIHLNIP